MTFPIQAPERLSLVPVIAMLLQFSTLELAEAEKAIRNPVWEPRVPKAVKLAPKILMPKSPPARPHSISIGTSGTPGTGAGTSYTPPPSPPPFPTSNASAVLTATR